MSPIPSSSLDHSQLPSDHSKNSANLAKDASAAKTLTTSDFSIDLADPATKKVFYPGTNKIKSAQWEGLGGISNFLAFAVDGELQISERTLFDKDGDHTSFVFGPDGSLETCIRAGRNEQSASYYGPNGKLLLEVHDFVESNGNKVHQEDDSAGRILSETIDSIQAAGTKVHEVRGLDGVLLSVDATNKVGTIEHDTYRPDGSKATADITSKNGDEEHMVFDSYGNVVSDEVNTPISKCANFFGNFALKVIIGQDFSDDKDIDLNLVKQLLW